MERGWFAVAPAPDEPRALLLHHATITAAPICVVYGSVALALGFPVHHILAAAAALGASIIARWFLHIGQPGRGAALLLAVCWLGQVALLYEEGWRSPTMPVFFVIITLGAAITGSRATLVLTAATIVVVLLAGFAERWGWTQPQPNTDFTSIALTWAWTLLLSGVLLHVLVRLFSRALLQVRATERKYRSWITQSPDGMMVVDEGRRIIEINPAATELFGLSVDEVIGLSVMDLPFSSDEQRAYAAEKFSALMGGEHQSPSEHSFRRPDGTVVHTEVNRRMLDRESDDDRPRMQATVRNVTERFESELATQELRGQLHHAQRLESVGRLAGGVAHEFNNCLTVILGSVDELEDAENLTDEQRQDVHDVRRAALRAADVTTKLLAFGRRRPRGTTVLSVNELIGGVETMIRRLVGETIRVTLRLAADPDNILADPTHVEQVLVNLVVNAVDAMSEHGGELTISTDRFISTRDDGSTSGRAEVVLSVRDTGEGMSDEVKERIFTPFFSTKAHGEGTGLGLSLVHGIVTQAEGHVEVSSAPGRGTEFRIHFPMSAAAPARAASRLRSRSSERAVRVLLVEDEPLVAKAAERILRRDGHEVVVAASGKEATACNGEFDVLITDVVLPDENGPALARKLTAQNPALKVLFMSGYDAGHLDADAPLLQKPFEATELLSKVQEVLG